MSLDDLIVGAFIGQAFVLLGMCCVMLHTVVTHGRRDLERLELLYHINENTENLVNLRRKKDKEV